MQEPLRGLRFLSRHPRLSGIILDLVASRPAEFLLTLPIALLAARPFLPRPEVILALLEKPGAAGSRLPYHPLVDFFYRGPFLNRVRLIRRFTYYPLLRILNRELRARQARARGETPVDLSTVLVSLPPRCNLACRGCLFTPRAEAGYLSSARFDYALSQIETQWAAYVAILGGGEPFLKNPDTLRLLAAASRHPRINFLIFTNGTCLDEEIARHLRMAGNILVLISTDGLREENDSRRGKGVYDRVARSFQLLRRNHIPFGFSATVHSENFREVTSPEFLEAMVQAGNLLGVYMQFVPLNPDHDLSLALNPKSLTEYRQRFTFASSDSPLPLIELRDFEAQRYVCRPKKGNLIHLDAVTGKISPCVLFPYSSPALNLYENPHPHRLAEILSSPFFQFYRSGAGAPSSASCHQDLGEELSLLARNPFLDPADRETVLALRQRLDFPSPGSTP